MCIRDRYHNPDHVDLVDVEEERGGRDAPRHEELVGRAEAEDRPVERVEEAHDDPVAEAERQHVELGQPEGQRNQDRSGHGRRRDPLGATSPRKSEDLK